MERLLLDDLTLLLLSPASGRPLVDSMRLGPGLAGAVLLELALQGRVEVEEAVRRRGDRLRVVPGPAPADPLLADALVRLSTGRAATHPTAARAAVEKIARQRLPRRARERLAAQGLAEHSPGGFLRLARTRPDAAAREELLALVGAALLSKDPRGVDQRSAALVSLLHAVGAVAKVVPATGLPKKELTARAKAVSEGEWAGAAVLAAVRAAQSAVTTAVVVAAAAGGSAGS